MRNFIKTLVAATAVVACGDSGTDSATGGGTTVVNPTMPATTGGDTTAASATSSTGLPTTGGGASESQGSSSTGAAATTEGVSDSGIKFDLGQVPDGGSSGCGGGGGGDPEFSYLWAANSEQGTISKINTETLVEEGRYIVRPDSAGSPSRTSVNLSGDVVVANREGGITKVYARPEDCADTNGMPGVQTATDGNYLAWGVEECIAWHTPMSYTSQRPVAWTQGTFNKATCKYENQKVWASGNNDTWEMMDEQLDVLLLNGDTGELEATIPIKGVAADFYGIYGAAVDGEGNFWGSQLSLGVLVNVDLETLEYKTWPMAIDGYGMTVDSKGYVWTCSWAGAARFDPMTETWQTAAVQGGGGCMEDGKGTLYMSGGGNMIIGVDTETLLQVKTLPIPNYVHGISIDFYGNVWGVTQFQPYAYRVHPDTMQVDTFTGLTGPYTYSDMTGFALSNAGTPSG